MRDHNGDHITAADVLADHEQADYYRGRPWPRYAGYEHLAIGAEPGEVWRQMHEYCEASWECLGCGKQVCPRCEPSPREFELCAECYWIADPGDGAA